MLGERVGSGKEKYFFQKKILSCTLTAEARLLAGRKCRALQHLRQHLLRMHDPSSQSMCMTCGPSEDMQRGMNGRAWMVFHGKVQVHCLLFRHAPPSAWLSNFTCKGMLMREETCLQVLLFQIQLNSPNVRFFHALMDSSKVYLHHASGRPFGRAYFIYSPYLHQ